MKFSEFKKQVITFPVFSTSQLSYLGENEQVLRNQLTEWQAKGLVLKLRKGLYVLDEYDRRITPSLSFLANQLYQPSYVSTEYALMFYDLIPERVYDITSVSTKKTRVFENSFGRFVFQHIKQCGYTGYHVYTDDNDAACFMAEPEKALVDFCYLNRSLFSTSFDDVFDSMRFQNTKMLRMKKITHYAESFKNARIKKVIEAFISYLKTISK